MMWVLIMLFMLAAGVAGFCFVVTRMARFSVIRNRFGKKRGRLVSFGILCAVLAGLFFWGSVWNALIIFIHLLLFWLLAEGLLRVIARSRRRLFSNDLAGGIAITATVCYIGVGVFFAHHVYRTAYTVETPQAEPFRVVGFSDSHTGTTFHGDKFPEFVEAMNRENPDIVVIAGDFVDDGTSYEDMLVSCAALAGLNTKYGVYFAFGNHDCGYSNSRGYGKAELVEALTANGVTVLEDETVQLTEEIYLCGRLDAGMAGRLDMAALTAELPEDSTLIVIDHQPNDYAAQAQAGADLVISGHTHGGQFFPINRAGEWIGANDRTYGWEGRGKTNFIVSSGISNWAFKIKTGCISEYFVIDMT